MRDLRTAVTALAAAASLAVPLASTTAAGAAPARPVIDLDTHWFGVALSPNGDHVQDKARVRYTLGRYSDVVVKVRRADEDRTLVFKDKLGKVAQGVHTWAWDGRNFKGKVVADGRYFAVFVADQVAANGKTKRVGTAVYVDTEFDVPWAPKVSSDTVFPNTTGYPSDSIWMTLGSDPSDPMTALGKVVQTIKDADGRVVSVGKPFQYHSGEYYMTMPLSFRGFDAQNNKLPAGTYRIRFKVWDMAGNPGGAKAVTVHVSDKPLVAATGSVTVPPTAMTAAASRTATGVSRKGGDDPQPIPCGVVVPSEVYADPGAMSYRSAETCGPGYTLPIAIAYGSVDLSQILTPEVAPRGVATSYVSMRGRPAVAGEADTAELQQYGIYSGGTPVVRSEATTEETVTSTVPASFPFEPPYSIGYTRDASWAITTHHTDWFDVAAVTVHFTYLTPQG